MKIYRISYDGRAPQPLDDLTIGELRNVIACPHELEVVEGSIEPAVSDADFIEQIRIILSLREQGAPI